MPANTETSPVWMITGYSTGLGRALAEAVLKHGHRAQSRADPGHRLKRARDKLDKFFDSLRQSGAVTVGADFPAA